LGPDDAERAIDRLVEVYDLRSHQQLAVARAMRRFAPERLIAAATRCLEGAAPERAARICRMLRAYESEAAVELLASLLRGSREVVVLDEGASALAASGPA